MDFRCRWSISTRWHCYFYFSARSQHFSHRSCSFKALTRLACVPKAGRRLAETQRALTLTAADPELKPRRCLQRAGVALNAALELAAAGALAKREARHVRTLENIRKDNEAADQL